LRLGTPACTTRGFKENEVNQVASWICEILNDINNIKKIEEVKQKVIELCKRFPVYK
jgi:glycine hydroxymethyltransferase